MTKSEAMKLSRDLEMRGTIKKESDNWNMGGNIFKRIDYEDENGNEAATLTCNGNLIAYWNGIKDGWTWRSSDYKKLIR